jgi:hypothetical protein
MQDSVRTHLPAVKAAVSPDQPFGVSLRLSAASAATLAADEGERRRFREFLDAEGLYVYTVNAFPYGPFKGRQVKEQVYEPDWSTEDRTAYTMRVADVLLDLSPEGVSPSIQTAPLAFRPNVVDDAYLAACTRNVLRVVAHLATIERETGRRIKLAIEPEPYCYLETTDETVAYFSEQLYSAAGVHLLSELAGLPVSEATGVLRRHLGVVFDICHQAVGFEDIPSSLAKLVAAGIPIFKLQEAAALWVPRVDADVVAALRAFTDTIYLSQTTELRNGQTTRYLNLEDALDAWDADPGERELRTHFHVPVFLDEIGPFRTTRFAVEQALAVHRQTPLSDHLEIETYTWDVLPQELKTGDIDEYVRRELEFVRGEVVGVKA